MTFLKYLTLTLSFACTIGLMGLEGAIIHVPPGANIQDAIDSAAAGDTIQLSAGTYKQPIQIISKNLTIKGAGKDITIIQAPNASQRLTNNFTFGADYFCVVVVDNRVYLPQTVDISDLTIDGNDQQDSEKWFRYGIQARFFAIGYHHAGGTITNVRTTNTRQHSKFDEPTGGGIIAAAMTGTISFNVTDCLIECYQRVGIDCRGRALTATISNNEVNRGYTLKPNTTTTTPNGIQFSGSVKGSIINNTISNNISTVDNEGGAGIFLFDAGPDITISQNTLNNNDYGIANINCAGNVAIHDNTSNSRILPGMDGAEGDPIPGKDYALPSTITLAYDGTFFNELNIQKKEVLKESVPSKKRKRYGVKN